MRVNIKKFTKPARRVLKLGRCGAVIVAAGNATRMEGIDKVMAPLKGEPMIVHTVRAFQDCPAISEIVVVTRPDLLEPVMGLCRDFSKLTCVVVGGEDRVGSVMNGMNALSEKVKLAAISDGARPLVTWELIDRTVRAANTYGAAVPGIPVKDTIKAVGGGLVTATPDRDKLRAIQTPQVFDYDLLRGALEQARLGGKTVTDDSSAVELLGFKVKLVQGEERNIKVTTPMDLKLAELLMEEGL